MNCPECCATKPGGHDAEHQEHRPAAEVAQVVDRHLRRAVSSADRVQRPGDRDVADVVAGARREGPVLSPAGHPPVDQGGVTRQAVGGADAEALSQQANPVAVGYAVTRRRQGQCCVDFKRLPRGVEQNGHDAELARGVHHHDELGPVRRHEGQAVTGSDALYGEMTSCGVARPLQLGVHPDFLTRQHAGMIGKLGGCRLEPEMHEAPGHGGNILLRIEIQRQHD